MATIFFLAIAAGIFNAMSTLILSFFIGTYMYYDAFHKYFAILVNEINNPPKSIKSEDSVDPPAIQHTNKIHAKRMLREIIQFHVIVKE